MPLQLDKLSIFTFLWQESSGDEGHWKRLLRVIGRYCWGQLQVHSVDLKLPACQVHVQYCVRPTVYSFLMGLRAKTFEAPLPLVLPVQSVSQVPSIQTNVLRVSTSSQLAESVHVIQAHIGYFWQVPLHQMPAVKELSTHCHQLVQSDLATKAHLYQWLAPQQPAVKRMSPKQYLKGFKVITKPIEMSQLRYTSHFKSQVERLKSIPMLRDPIPAHRFSTEQRAVFRTRLAEQCPEEGSILLRYVYDRVSQGVFEQLKPESDGVLLCVYKQDKRLLDLHQVNTQLGMVVVGQHMVTRQTVTAFVSVSDLAK